MSIFKTKLTNYTQNFEVSKENKSLYGEVRTDFKLIEQMFHLIPSELFKNLSLKWCDPCCGNGYFSIFLYFHLFKNLTEIKSLKKRHAQVINMMTMIEINKEYQKELELLKRIYLKLIPIQLSVLTQNLLQNQSQVGSPQQL